MSVQEVGPDEMARILSENKEKQQRGEEEKKSLLHKQEEGVGDFGELVVLGPTKQHLSTCIWMHGLGFNTGPVWMQRFIEFREKNTDRASPLHTYLHHTRFVFPTAPLRPMAYAGGTENHGWYNVFGKGSRNDEPAPGIGASAKYIHSLVAAETELLQEVGGSGKNILLAGFSQGGTMTTVAGHTCPHALGGLCALSGYSCSTKNYFTPDTISQFQLRTPYLIMHGDHDDIVLPSYAEETKRLLTELRTAAVEVKMGGQGQEERVLQVKVGTEPAYKMIAGLDHSVIDMELHFIFATYGVPIMLPTGSGSA